MRRLVTGSWNHPVWRMLIFSGLVVSWVSSFGGVHTLPLRHPHSLKVITTKSPSLARGQYQDPQQQRKSTTPTKSSSSFSSSSTSTCLFMSTPFLSSSPSSLLKAGVAIVGTAAVAGTAVVKLVLDRPSRTYSADSVAREYDAWAADGILEYYWGEHIHLGYYSPEEMKAGYKKKNFIQAKYDFIDEMMAFGGIDPNEYSSNNNNQVVKVLDVGCGFGGTSRYLAKKLGPNSRVTGITLSPAQVQRGTELAQEQGVEDNTKFLVMDALNMNELENDTFDIVWACESGEHMPDKQKYISEMMRVLKPGGKFVMACWCQRDDQTTPFSRRDERDLKFLYEEWTHPYFVSIEKFAQLIQETNVMETPVKTANWVEETIASWRHSIWVGVYDPRGWIFKPKTYVKCFRDAYCLERMHRAFKRGLMEYGMFAATKKKAKEEETATSTTTAAASTTT